MEIHKIKDDREKNIDPRGQRHIVNVWHLSDPPSFSLLVTFKAGLRIYLEPPLLLLQPVLHPTDGVLGSLSDEEAAGSPKGTP
jgi:hypothetical protein